ncbi:methyltransferase domain-containing protein [Thermoflexibacter ruber]|uniref:Methyltransferase domain-containing protein n=1 Tax=Thermoflexibacter ruber TaxID=1003 RepID=A0A1I2EI25_9BACT|nr:methyltransferase domain-containing protein [Thermoflexibacter ruber]SFE92343.1 Methyltransferase domain-containing protein [Thermoflexibacter ruber]
MFESRSSQPELMDDLSLANEALKKNLDELELVNKYLGGNSIVIGALKKLHRQGLLPPNQSISIADLGCGGGDTLREIFKWGKQHKLNLQLIDIDANPFMLDYAQDKAKQKKADIHFKKLNIFSDEFENQKFDIVICSLFCHHFTDAELVKLFSQIQNQIRIAFIINDLHRHWFAYYSIKYITKILRGSYLVQHDAPLSVLRAFKYQELKNLLQQADIQNYTLHWKWAFRYRGIIYK